MQVQASRFQLKELLQVAELWTFVWCWLIYEITIYKPFYLTQSYWLKTDFGIIICFCLCVVKRA